MVVLLEPRDRYSEPGDLPVELAAELGVLIGRLDRAIRAVDGSDCVHVGRWGERGAHLHILVRGPAGRYRATREQLRGDLGRRPAADPRGHLAGEPRIVVASLEAG